MNSVFSVVVNDTNGISIFQLTPCRPTGLRVSESSQKILFKFGLYHSVVILFSIVLFIDAEERIHHSS